ncbi:DNA replication helicase/nuclease 2 isoform X2 [Anticarsia gemmatalis]|uniref:DNA replication helicase/nuclease 2 isoform X2 n=1 Tax=Anticarsia gemmatalis TaxID=129554 RepID=UPI003F776865
MPRALSLKKQAGPSKNQKSITAFLKSTTNGASQKQVSPEKSSNSQSCTEPKSSKRKALSPVVLDKINVESSDNNVEHNLPNGSISNTPKKLKTECNQKSSSPKKRTAISPNKKSPNKENTLEKWLSPKKNLKEQLETAHSSQNGNHINKDSRNTTDFTETMISNHKPPIKLEVNNHVISVFENGSKLENHVTKAGTPVKKSPFKTTHSPRRSRTPKKSPLPEFKCSPISQLRTPDKTLKEVTSPSKSGSTVKILDFGPEEMCDDFGDEWEVDDIEEDIVENLDLSTMQRCEILTVHNNSNRVELKLKDSENNRGTCFVEGVWLYTPFVVGDIISVLASRNSAGQYCVNNTSGLIVLRPDHLVSSTSVVAGVFCKRKAILQERWRGIDSANTAMTTGILIHELVQKALTQNITSMEQLRAVTDNIIKESVGSLYDAGLSEEKTRNNIHNYIPPLTDFMNTYVAPKPPTVANVQKDKNNWSGHIDKVLDIEENLCCPKLGLKGKIDATLQVTIHERKGRQRAVVPLELKSGKASMSAEHRGQLVLYGMMLNLHNREDPTTAEQRGLLLYLKDRVELREVSCGYPERRDLIMLRNQLVHYLAPSPQDIDQEQLTDIEDASALLQQKLPEPVDHHNACAKCPYLTLCSLHLWHTDGPTVSECHPLSKLRPDALGHLSEQHVKYFLHWTALLKMEERGQMVAAPLHALWTDTVEKRAKRGTCAANLKLKTVQPSGDRHLHVFLRNSTENGHKQEEVKTTKGPQENDFSIVSIENRPWIAAGVVTVSNSKEIHILLERDVSRRLDKNTVYHIDTYESYATTVQNLTNLGVLMEDSDRAHRLRKIIIDKEPPHFDSKLPREVGRLGTKLMRSLNIQQQRAVLKALAAKDYALLQGLPGTGKTQTISVLIQMLVALKLRVLVTAHTHSAVDTVLTRIPDTVRVLRLGSSSRVAAALNKRTEQVLTAKCDTPEQLADLYDSMEVVGVTCLGAAHAMLARTTFDICIVDEATQVLQCTVLRPLFAAKRFVLVGDPEQLPPVVRSKAARRLGMEESLFHRLSCEEATSTLQLQYRMNQALADVANTVAYDGKLKCADQKIAEATLNIDIKKISHLTSASPWLETACSPSSEHAVLFIDVDTTDDVTDSLNSNKNVINSTEACVVIAVVEALKQGGVKPSDIGVIAPYRDQVALLRRSLSRYSVEVSTVDQFQGRDKSVIVYSCTKRALQDGHKVKEGEVLNDQRRLAVSVTRAKHKLLIIGNSTALQRYAPLQRLITTCNSIKVDKSTVADIRTKYSMFVA